METAYSWQLIFRSNYQNNGHERHCGSNIEDLRMPIRETSVRASVLNFLSFEAVHMEELRVYDLQLCGQLQKNTSRCSTRCAREGHFTTRDRDGEFDPSGWLLCAISPMMFCNTVLHLLHIPLAKPCSENNLPIGTNWVSRLVRAVPASIVPDPGQKHDLLRPVR